MEGLGSTERKEDLQAGEDWLSSGGWQTSDAVEVYCGGSRRTGWSRVVVERLLNAIKGTRAEPMERLLQLRDRWTCGASPDERHRAHGATFQFEGHGLGGEPGDRNRQTRQFDSMGGYAHHS